MNDNQKPKGLLSTVRDRMRRFGLAYRTEESYIGWMRRFIRYCGGRHPRELGADEVEGFLTYLAVERRCSASTQNQALSALLFLYREVLKIELPWVENFQRAKRPRNLPIVLSEQEVSRVLTQLDGVPRLAFAGGASVEGSGCELE